MTPPICLCVFGISGVGKTTLIAKALANIQDGLHLQASALIKQGLADPLKDSEMLRRSSGDRILANQMVLIEMFDRACAVANARVTVFDGHLIIDTDKGLFEIPLYVIAALKPGLLVHVDADPAVIALRRSQDTARSRPARSAEVLDAHQAKSRALCREYSTTLGIERVCLEAGAIDELDELLRSIH
jgi:adenylate kinase